MERNASGGRKKKTPFFKERADQRRPCGAIVGGQATAWCYPPSTHLDSCEHSFQKDGAKGLSLKKETKKTLLAANDSYARRNALNLPPLVGLPTIHCRRTLHVLPQSRGYNSNPFNNKSRPVHHSPFE